jgi:hypothetical protein
MMRSSTPLAWSPSARSASCSQVWAIFSSAQPYYQQPYAWPGYYPAYGYYQSYYNFIIGPIDIGDIVEGDYPCHVRLQVISPAGITKALTPAVWYENGQMIKHHQSIQADLSRHLHHEQIRFLSM